MDNIEAKNTFTKKEMCYFIMVDKFFKKCPPEMITKMINIINKTDNISLRILDWYVTRYAKKHMENIKPINGTGECFDVHINYKAQLKSYKKKYFDPFRRKSKFKYTFDINGEKVTLVTTIGQLNFFSWAIKNNILSFVDSSLPQITKAMNLSNKEDKKKKLEKRKNSDISDSISDTNSDDDSDMDEDYNEDYDDNDNDNDNDSEYADVEYNINQNKNINTVNNITVNNINNPNTNDDKNIDKSIVRKNMRILNAKKEKADKTEKKDKKNVSISALHKIDNDEFELTLRFD